MGEKAGLAWTGHALIDVGIAGICAFRDRREPETVTLDDLDAVSDFMVETYYQGKLGTFLSCVFMNASFVQPNESDAKRSAFIEQYLRAHRAEPDPRVAGMRCAFSGAAAISALVRTHLPLFSAEGIFNFRPGGSTFVPASGPTVVALLFLPMASRRAEGRLLAVHADDPALTLRFARRYLHDNRRLLALSLPSERALVHEGYERERAMWDSTKKRYKFADVKGPRSLVVADLAAIAADALPTDRRPRPAALTAYLISNSGQGPSLEVFEVPSGVVSFVGRAAQASTRSAWEAVSQRFRPVDDVEEDTGADVPKRPGRRGAAPVAGRAGWTRNPAFEELTAVFDAGFTDRGLAARWLRRHLLGRMESRAGDVRYQPTRARSWALAELFLKEVLGMNNGRIEAIRRFADKLAGRIHEKNDRQLYRAITFEKMRDLRHALLRAQRESTGSGLLFGLDEYAQVWLSDEADEYLVRDLVCIRVVERLADLGHFAEHPEDAIEEANAEEALS